MTENLPASLASKFDLVGPTVDDDVRRVILRYGAEAVKVAVKQQTKARRGRKPIPDWPELLEVFEADAKEWIAGGDPFKSRTDYSIAKQYAEKNPGQSSISTMERIERKLKTRPYDRRWHMLVTAQHLTQSAHSYLDHLRALEALLALPGAPSSELWRLRLSTAKAAIADYVAKQGHPPSDNLTMDEIEKVARNAFLLGQAIDQYNQKRKTNGLFGIAEILKDSETKSS